MILSLYTILLVNSVSNRSKYLISVVILNFSINGSFVNGGGTVILSVSSVIIFVLIL